MENTNYFIVLIIGVLLCYGIGYFFINGIGASDGEHTGYITAIEFNNNIIWDANLVYFKTDTESTQEDIYCINNKNLKLQLKKAAELKEHITIQYKHPFFFWKWLCNGGESIIIGIIPK